MYAGFFVFSGYDVCFFEDECVCGAGFSFVKGCPGLCAKVDVIFGANDAYVPVVWDEFWVWVEGELLDGLLFGVDVEIGIDAAEVEVLYGGAFYTTDLEASVGAVDIGSAGYFEWLKCSMGNSCIDAFMVSWAVIVGVDGGGLDVFSGGGTGYAEFYHKVAIDCDFF